MNALALALLASLSCRAADFDRFDPAAAVPGAAVAVSSRPEAERPEAPAADAAASFADWSKLAERPLGIAEGERPAWTRVEPKRKPWAGPKRLERLDVTPQFVNREDVDGVSRLSHRDDPAGTSAAFMAAPGKGGAAGGAGAGAKAAVTAMVMGQMGLQTAYANGQVWAAPAGPGEKARLVERDESRMYGQRNLWEITGADGTVRMVRASPLVFDLKGGGVRTSAKTVLYDLYGTGSKQRMEWINDLAPGMGLLVFDARKDGRPGEDGLGLFGDSTDLDGDGKADGYLDGFKALRAFVAKAIREKVIGGRAWKDGVLSAEDLKALEKAYGLKMRVGGLNEPPRSLAAAGVSAISFTGEKVETVNDFDHQGNDCARQKGAVFLRADGSTGGYDDVWFKPKNNVMVVGK